MEIHNDMKDEFQLKMYYSETVCLVLYLNRVCFVWLKAVFVPRFRKQFALVPPNFERNRQQHRYWPLGRRFGNLESWLHCSCFYLRQSQQAAGQWITFSPFSEGRVKTVTQTFVKT